MTFATPRRVTVCLALAIPLLVACEKKKAPAPAQPTYQVGSVIFNLPPGVSVPYPQGRPDEANVNATKCNFVVDRQIKFMTEKNPEARVAIQNQKPMIMQECETKWTQPQYDCTVAAKSLEELLRCKRFQKP
jgi:hypothetical protein